MICSWECTAHCSRSIYVKHGSSEYIAAALVEVVCTKWYGAQYNTLIVLATALAFMLLLVSLTLPTVTSTHSAAIKVYSRHHSCTDAATCAGTLYCMARRHNEAFLYSDRQSQLRTTR
eukprot:11719-Heterococcus_DN1.PRE.9